MWTSPSRRSFLDTLDNVVTDAQITPYAFTVAGAAAYSNISRSQLYVLMKDNELSSVKIRGRRMILRESLDKLFAQSPKTN